jgi:glycerol-1-phosphate dehydrogenase [NAD(P)+]
VYVGESTPDPLIVDFNLLRSAPPALNIAGIGDLLSIHTATVDWEYAQRRGKSEYPFSTEDVAGGRNILQQVYSRLADIRENSDEGLMAIVEGYMAMNKICIPAGHYRIEEGSEHYLFYELEERLARPFVHGYIIGLGIYLMSRLQDNQYRMITEVMDNAGLLYHPCDMGVEKKDLLAALLNVKRYVASRPNLWFTVINDSEITEDWAIQAMEGLRF